MSDTPRTLQEQCYGTCHAACERIEDLERELASANNQIGLLISGAKKDERTIKYLQERIQRLVKAGDRLSNPFAVGENDIKEWTAAKEEKAS